MSLLKFVNYSCIIYLYFNFIYLLFYFIIIFIITDGNGNTIKRFINILNLYFHLFSNILIIL